MTLAASKGGRTHPQAQKRPRSRAWVLRRALVVADLAGLLVALALTQTFAVRILEPQEIAITGLLIVAFPGWVLLAQMYGLYDHVEIGVARSTADDLPGLVLMCTFATWIGLLIVNASGIAHPRLGIATTFWVATIVLIVIGRALARWLVQRSASLREPTLIIGTGHVAERIAIRLASRPDYCLDVAGFIDDDPLDLPEDLPPLLGKTGGARADRAGVRHRTGHRGVSRASSNEHVDLLRRCTELRVRVEVVPRMYEVIGSRTYVHDLGGIPLVSLGPSPADTLGPPDQAILRPRLREPRTRGPRALLRPRGLADQGRISRSRCSSARSGWAQGKRFELLKFRTMDANAEARKAKVGALNKHTEAGPRMFKVADDPRVTTFGRFLRSWSLDELPQLFNVLRGEMSLVGPRPLILDEDDNVLGQHRRRLHLTPGLTGLWQVPDGRRSGSPGRPGRATGHLELDDEIGKPSEPRAVEQILPAVNARDHPMRVGARSPSSLSAISSRTRS